MIGEEYGGTLVPITIYLRFHVIQAQINGDIEGRLT
jgi:hypothetical protein